MSSISFLRSTVLTSPRISSASRREASEMSEISRFSRSMSWTTIAISLARCSGSRVGRAATSIADRREVRGFLSWCATSAARGGVEAAKGAGRFGEVAQVGGGALDIFGEAVGARQVPADPVAEPVGPALRHHVERLLGRRQRRDMDAAGLAQHRRIAQQL